MVENTQCTFQSLLDELPLQIVVTPRLKQELHRKGIASATQDDSRVMPRFHTNGASIMRCVQSPASLKITHDAMSRVIVRDLSRTGVCLIADHQWFPDEICEVIFAIGKLQARVMRARCLGPRCWEIGLRISMFDREAITTTRP